MNTAELEAKVDEISDDHTLLTIPDGDLILLAKLLSVRLRSHTPSMAACLDELLTRFSARITPTTSTLQ